MCGSALPNTVVSKSLISYIGSQRKNFKKLEEAAKFLDIWPQMLRM